MKRIKTVNGWLIFQITTAKKAEQHDCEIGGYIRISKSEYECYGVSKSEADLIYGLLPLEEVIADCETSENGSQY